MTTDEALAINLERMDDWARLLAVSKATAVIAIGVGHDEHSGKVHLCLVDSPLVHKQVIARLLRNALRQLGG